MGQQLAVGPDVVAGTETELRLRHLVGRPQHVRLRHLEESLRAGKLRVLGGVLTAERGGQQRDCDCKSHWYWSFRVSRHYSPGNLVGYPGEEVPVKNRVIIIAVVVVAAFLLGFLPQYVKAQ